MKLLQFIKNCWDEHIKIYQSERFSQDWEEFMKHHSAWSC